MIVIIRTLESLKWSMAIFEVIHMLFPSLIMAVILSVHEMQIWRISPEMEGDVKFSNSPPFLLSIKQQFSNCV